MNNHGERALTRWEKGLPVELLALMFDSEFLSGNIRPKWFDHPLEVNLLTPKWATRADRTD